MTFEDLSTIEHNIAQVRPFTLRTTPRLLIGPAGPVGLITGRSKRPQFRRGASGPTHAIGPLSRRETPPALFAIDGELRVQALDVGRWVDRAKARVPENPSAEDLSSLARDLGAFNPAPSDAEAWVALNLFHTALQSSIEVSDSFVIATRPEQFALDWHELPIIVLAAFVRAWQVIEELARQRGEIPLLFANTGGPPSGRSLPDPHAQAQLCVTRPDLYRVLTQNQSGLADISSTAGKLEIDVPDIDELALFAHPAPEHNYTLAIVPRRPVERLAEVNPLEIATVLHVALLRLVALLGPDSAYNIVCRGLGAGHLHLEVIPRTTNIRGGAEIAAGSATIDVDPRFVRERFVTPA